MLIKGIENDYIILHSYMESMQGCRVCSRFHIFIYIFFLLIKGIENDYIILHSYMDTYIKISVHSSDFGIFFRYPSAEGV